MPFKFDSTSFFLTYPQSDLDNQHVIDAINAICELEWARACRELHEDGQPHTHVVGKFKRRFQSRNERIFDIQGRHPNIQPIRSIPRAIDYVSKDGDYIDYGTVPSAKAKRTWTHILEAAKGPKVDWLQVVHEERISMHVSKRLRELLTSESVDLDDYDGRPVSESLQQVPTEFTSMQICGPAGIGKTGWAMQHMPRPCLLAKHVDTLRAFRPGYHKSILFDDCDFKHFPRPTQLMLCDYENQVQIHCRYGVAYIPAHIPRVFLCNPGEEPFVSDSAIQGRRLSVYYLF